MNKDCHILHVVDHRLILLALESVFAKEFTKSTLISVSSIVEAEIELNKQKIDLIILDLQLVEANGMDFIKFLRQLDSAPPILVYTFMHEEIYGIRVIQAGANGFLSKSEPKEQMIIAIKTILSGNKNFSDLLKSKMASFFEPKNTQSLYNKLINKEFEVIRMILNGKGLKKVCNDLSLRPSTISTFKSKTFPKLSIQNLIELKEVATLYGM
jgi:DNA-binding NarL/FixJ family response regulator